VPVTIVLNTSCRPTCMCCQDSRNL